MAQPIIQFRDVSIKLGGKQILDRLTFDVMRGERFVILGFSGSGKSVTLKNMTGLMKPDSGSIKVAGEQIVGLAETELAPIRRKFGYLFQGGALINWLTVGENIELPIREHTRMNERQRAELVEEKLRLVALAGEGHKYPSDISGGMKKRAALARAIALDPEVLVLDEPTSGLDPVLSRQIDQLTNEINKKLGITCIVVTHDMESAYDIGDRIALFKDGRMHCVLTPEEFRTSEDPEVVRFATGGKGRPTAAAGK